MSPTREPNDGSGDDKTRQRPKVIPGGVRIASRHHTVQDQARLLCRLLAHQIAAFVDEIDEGPETAQLRLLAEDLRRAGGDGPEQPQPPTGKRRLTLVAS